MTKKANKRAQQITLGAKYIAPRAPQRLGATTQAELEALFNQCDAIGLKVAIWSIHELVGHLDEVAVEGSGLTLRHRFCWPELPDVACDLPSNPTFRDRAHAADKLIEASGDLQHRFIESFEYTPTTGMIDLFCGS